MPRKSPKKRAASPRARAASPRARAASPRARATSPRARARAFLRARDCSKPDREVVIVWTRHCESRANVGETFKEVAVVEALCTCRGVVQSYLASKTIFSYIASRWGKSTIALCSSALPRAMETAQELSIGRTQDGMENISFAPLIFRLPYITERYDADELKIRNLRHYGTSNTTTLLASNAQARGLNARRMGMPISVSAADTAVLALSADHRNGRIAHRPDDYELFLNHVVPTLDSAGETVYCVVGHGWYIRDLVVSTAARPPEYEEETRNIETLDNLESVVVRYSLTENRVCKSELIGHIPETVKLDEENPALPGYAPEDLKKFVHPDTKSTCQGTYDDKDLVARHFHPKDLYVNGERGAH